MEVCARRGVSGGGEWRGVQWRSVQWKGASGGVCTEGVDGGMHSGRVRSEVDGPAPAGADRGARKGAIKGCAVEGCAVVWMVCAVLWVRPHLWTPTERRALSAVGVGERHVFVEDVEGLRERERGWWGDVLAEGLRGEGTEVLGGGKRTHGTCNLTQGTHKQIQG